MAARKIYISYAREDSEFLLDLVAHCSPFTKEDQITLEYEAVDEAPGSRWLDETADLIRSSDVFVMLVSRNYINSDYCFDKEAVLARQLQEQGNVHIVPIYVSPVATEHLWFSELTVLPAAGQPLSHEVNRDDALKQICMRLADPEDPLFDSEGSSNALSRREDVHDVLSQQKRQPTLNSALDRYDSLFDALFLELSSLEYRQMRRAEDIRQVILNAINKASGAYALLHYRGNCEVGAAGDNEKQQFLSGQFVDAFRYSEWAFQSPLGGTLDVRDGRHEFTLSVLPLSADCEEGLILLSPKRRGLAIDEILLFSAREIFELTKGFEKRCPVRDLEKAVYDHLKRRYQYVSKRMYAERMSIFRADLQNIHMQFEPIYSFDNVNHSLVIYAWEALARVGDKQSAPVDILKAAELWGSEFRSELDVYVLERSIVTYNEEARKNNGSRLEDIRPLSINIYPDSLFQPAYHAMLEKMLAEERLLNGRKLVLEISEKSIIDETDDNGSSETVQQFINLMETLRAKYRMRFAIDDFGAGHSSIIRLNHLKPEWVKIDREILHCEPKFAKSLIQNLLNIKSDWGRAAFKVIIEGVDKDNDIKLRELVNEVGVEYLQGYQLGKSQTEIISRPSKEHFQSLKSAAGW